MSPLLHRCELTLWSLPWAEWILIAEALLVAVALAMVVSRLIPRLVKSRVNTWAYRHSRWLRISQSPVWYGALLAFGAVLALHLATLQMDPRMRSWAVQAELTAPGEEHPLIPLRRSASAPDARLIDLQAIQTKWVAAWRAKEGLVFAPRPLSSDDPVLLAQQAKQVQDETRLMEVLAAAGVLVGLVSMLVVWSREAVGARHHGRAAWAARSEVCFTEDGYFRLPMQVTQRGTRTWEKTFSAPYTVLGPSRKSNTGHGLMIGPTGSGKGAYSLGHFFVTSPVPIIYQDNKGETPVHQLRPEMLRFGIPARRPKGLPSMRFNPIEWALDPRKSENERADACRTLANYLLPGPPEDSQNKWITDTAQPILAQGFLRGRWLHLGELADEIEGRPLPDLLKELGVGAGRTFAMGGKNVMEYAATELSNNTQPYLRGWARHAFSASDFTLEDVFRRGCYVMSATEDPLQKIPIKLFWNLLWSEAQSGEAYLPCLMLMDEAIAAGKIPGLLDAGVKLRDRGISVWVAFQTYAGISSVYAKDSETLRRVLVNSIVLTNGLDPKDAAELVEELGHYTHTEKPKTQGASTQYHKFPLIPQSDLVELAGQEDEHWAIIRGRGMSTSGRPILAKLHPIDRGLWNSLASDGSYEAEARKYGHGDTIVSRYVHLLEEGAPLGASSQDSKTPDGSFGL